MSKEDFTQSDFIPIIGSVFHDHSNRWFSLSRPF